MNYDTPLDWKSEVWWANRPLEERLHHLRLPARIVEEGMLVDIEDVDFLDTYRHGTGLIIRGKSGSGKSKMAAEILDALIRHHQISGRWVQADNYIEMLKDSFDNDGKLGDEYSNPYIIKYLKAVWDVVVLDGLGDERQTDFALHELGSLVRSRFDRMKSTIITTTLQPGDIKNKYGARLATVLADFDTMNL